MARWPLPKSSAAALFVLDAINEKAAALYRRVGFQEMPSHPGRMIISIAKMRRNAQEAAGRGAGRL